VKRALGRRTFQLASDASITADGKSGVRLNDLKVGDQLNVTYQEVADALVAHRIEQVSTPPIARQ
jgi:hypothetical protein